MHAQKDPDIVEVDPKERERALRSLKEVAQRARFHLPPEDKADILDLVLDVFLDLPTLLEQPAELPIRIGVTMQMIAEIASGLREDVTPAEVTEVHDRETTEGTKPTEYVKWKGWISAKVRALREQREWTQEDLAKRSKLPQSHISRIERAKHSPSRRTIERLAEAFGLSVGDLDPSEN